MDKDIFKINEIDPNSKDIEIDLDAFKIEEDINLDTATYSDDDTIKISEDVFDSATIVIPNVDEDSDATVDLSKFAVADDEGNLDDSRLSEDFVIGQDFFIDSTEADSITQEENESKPEDKKKKRKKRKSSAGAGCLMAVIWMAAILIISFTSAAIILYFGMDYLGISMDEDSAIENIEIVVTEGTSATEIAEMLEEKGIISSASFFRFYASRGGHAAKFRDGVYYFSKQDSYEDIVDKLTKQGKQAAAVRVTIPEGWTIDKIADRLEENKICSAQQFKEAVNEATYEKYNYEFMKGIKQESQGVHYRLEGYLFPVTYDFYQTNDKSGAEQVIKKMLDNFDKKLIPELRIKAEERGVSIHDIVTMASMIEMEASVANYSDKQKVSAVFWNRINEWGDKAYLQSDPTRNYRYNTNSYDTYQIVGLAPGAYCSPSIDSIKAAVFPDPESKEFFFVTDKNMKFYFTKTDKEHEKVIKDLKKQGLWIESK